MGMYSMYPIDSNKSLGNTKSVIELLIVYATWSSVELQKYIVITER